MFADRGDRYAGFVADQETEPRRLVDVRQFNSAAREIVDVDHHRNRLEEHPRITFHRKLHRDLGMSTPGHNQRNQQRENGSTHD